MERETGNGERGTGVWKLVYSGNPPDNLIQNGGRRKQRGNKCNLVPRAFSSMHFRAIPICVMPFRVITICVMPFYVMPLCVMPFCVIPICVMLFSVMPLCVMPFCVMPFCVMPLCVMPFCVMPFTTQYAFLYLD